MPVAPRVHGAERRKQESRQRDRDRGTAAERGYDARWRSYRLMYLMEHPLCVRCLQRGIATLATVVDHVRPHRGDQTLFWQAANHQSLCAACHSAKTATEDGGFGHAGKM